MAEISKKRARKTKLVPRDCADIEEEAQSSIVHLQDSSSSHSLLPRLRTGIDRQPEPEAPAPQMEFSINIEVEEFDDEDVELDTADPCPMVNDMGDKRIPLKTRLAAQRFLRAEEYYRAVERSFKSKDPVDRLLAVEIKNYWGKIRIRNAKPEDDIWDRLTQEAVMAWRSWNAQSKIRSSVFCYKCYICKRAWWHLYPFRDHLKIHEDVKVDVEIKSHECSVIAYTGTVPKEVKLPADGPCWRCLNNMDDHQLLTLYTCDACGDRYFTCSALFDHEGVCQKFQKMIYKDTMAFESDWKCNICNTYCLTQLRHNAHLVLQHSVRSDVPMPIPLLKNCSQCTGKYYSYYYHACPAKMDLIKCSYCFRKFQNQFMEQFHEKVNKSDMNCKFCGKYLKKVCMEMEHIVKHSRIYMLVYKCMDCEEMVLFADEASVRTHILNWHYKKLDRRRYHYDTIFIPKICMSYEKTEPIENMVKPPIAPTKTNKDTVIQAKESDSVIPVQSIKEETNDFEIQENDIAQQLMLLNSHKEKKHAAQQLLLHTIKQETGIHEDTDTLDSNISITDEITVVKNEILETKEEKMDTYEIVDDIDDYTIQEENDAYMETLSKVFEASQNVTESIQPEQKVKIEPEDLKDSDDDDIVIINNDNHNKIDLTNDEEDLESTRPKTKMSIKKTETEGFEIKGKRDRKVYKCKCGFQGVHRDFRRHLDNKCPVKPFRTGRTSSANMGTVWGWVYKCTKCNITYSTLKKYMLHFSKHQIPYCTCPKCLQDFKSIGSLASHFLIHVRHAYVKFQVISKSSWITSNISGMFKCKTCRATVAVANFFEHFERHFQVCKVAPEKTVVESIKDEVGTLQESALPPALLKELLEKLVTSEEPRNRAARKCIVCHRWFERRNDCKRHIIEHLLCDAFASKPKYRKLRCQLCFQDFDKQDLYKRHMRDHGSMPLYQCEECNKAFSDSSNFTKHKKVHNLAVLVCDICNKKFQAKLSIEKHMLMHMQTGPSPCKICNRMFYCESSLRKHLRIVHLRKPPRFLCPYCKKVFPSVKEKCDHMWTVHNDRKEKADCPLCKKSFRKFLDVKRHMKYDHKVNSPFFKKDTMKLQADVEDFLSQTDVHVIKNESDLLVVYDDS